MRVAGFGFRASASADSLHDALRATGVTANALATAEDKAENDAFSEFAAQTGLPIIAVPARDLETIETLTQSPASQSARNTGSLAEAAALAAAGPGARLVGPRQISQDRLATCAVAESEAP